MSNKKTVLLISDQGDAPHVVAGGFVDVLRAAGWNAITRVPKSKRATRETIEFHDVNLIMTNCRYGTNMLPIDTINKKNIGVMCHAFCYNDKNETFEVFSELATKEDIRILKSIDNVVLWSQHEPEANERWFGNWEKNGFNFIFLPHSANIIRLFPSSFDIQRDLIFIGNAAHKPIATRDWLMPLIRKKNLRTLIFGGGWNNFGINARHLAPHFDNFNNLYPTSAICLNIHSEAQRNMNVLFNDRSFMLPLCGGFSISDSQLSKRYFGDLIPVANTPREFRDLTLHYLDAPQERHDIVIEAAKVVANKHTYFDRMYDVFKALGLHDDAATQKQLGKQFTDIYLDNLESIKDQLHKE